MTTLVEVAHIVFEGSIALHLDDLGGGAQAVHSDDIHPAGEVLTLPLSKFVLADQCPIGGRRALAVEHGILSAIDTLEGEHAALTVDRGGLPTLPSCSAALAPCRSVRNCAGRS